MADKDVPLYVMVQPATFDWKVQVPVPVAGEYRFAEFTATFPNMDDEGVNQVTGPDADGKPRNERQIAKLILLGFRDLAGDDGQPLAFNEDNVDKLLRMPRAATSIVATFVACVRGMAPQKKT